LPPLFESQSTKLKSINVKEFMRNVIVMACMAIMPLTYAAAEGYLVNAQSAKQSGMGHVGTAMKLGSESMHFNPAAMVFMDKNIDLSAGVSGVFSSGKYKNLSDGYSVKTDSKVSTPLFLYAGFKIYDNLAAGVMLNTPYGSSIKWGNDWEGAHLIQDISLKVFNIQPTISWKITNRLSVGAGLMMEYGSINLDRALIAPGAMSGLANKLFTANPALEKLVPQESKAVIAKYDNVSAASVGLTGDAGIRMGYNVGAMFDVNDKITIGASYRSKVTAKVKEGEVNVNYANELEFKELLKSVNSLLGKLPQGSGVPTEIEVPSLDNGTFSAELPLPSVLSAGITYYPTNRWTVSGEVQFNGWGTYKMLMIKFNPDEELGKYNISAPKKYKNSRTYRLGGQYAATKRLDVRMGAYFDETPVKDDYLNPETPSMNKLGLSAGLSFRPLSGLSVDVAFSYITGFGRNGSYTDKDLLGQPRTFGGHYNIAALMPSIGLSYAF